MKKKELKQLSSLFKYKTVSDNHGNEFVLFSNSGIKHIDDIDDKTQFEGFENHIHLVDDVKPKDRKKLLKHGSYIAKAVAYDLKNTFPNKKFVVWLSCSDSLIIRFHQVWENEPYYYIPDNTTLQFETDNM